MFNNFLPMNFSMEKKWLRMLKKCGWKRKFIIFPRKIESSNGVNIYAYFSFVGVKYEPVEAYGDYGVIYYPIKATEYCDIDLLVVKKLTEEDDAFFDKCASKIQRATGDNEALEWKRILNY